MFAPESEGLGLDYKLPCGTLLPLLRKKKVLMDIVCPGIRRLGIRLQNSHAERRFRCFSCVAASRFKTRDRSPFLRSRCLPLIHNPWSFPIRKKTCPAKYPRLPIPRPESSLPDLPFSFKKTVVPVLGNLWSLTRSNLPTSRRQYSTMMTTE